MTLIHADHPYFIFSIGVAQLFLRFPNLFCAIMNQHQLTFFHSVPIFARLPDDALAEVAAGFYPRVYARSDYLFWEDEQATTFFVMAAGRVRLFKTSDQGREFTFFIANTRQVFDLPPLFDSQVHPVSAAALSDARVYVASLAHVQEMAHRYPALYRALARQLSQATRRIANTASELALTDVTTRLARLLIVSSETKGQPTDDGILLTLELSQSEIAHLLGTAREVVSRAFRSMERDGLVRRTRHGILIRNPQKLEALARLPDK
jgi:CRP/FNR family transcriptional regulator